jgi:hypothetical protein
LILWRAGTGEWLWTTSSTGYTDGNGQQFGSQPLGDVPLIGDIDGDGKTDLVVWRASSGTFYWAMSSRAFADGDSRRWGSQAAGDVPRLGDVDGDGRSDLAVWRASSGTWYWLRSRERYSYSTFGSRQFGSQPHGDIPMMK